MVIGRANLFFLSKCSSIFCYSDKILNFPIKFKDKIKIIPPLLRKDIYSTNKNKNINISDKMRILIIGGSQGADYFQKNLKETILKISRKCNLEIIHQTNKKNETTLKTFI